MGRSMSSNVKNKLYNFSVFIYSPTLYLIGNINIYLLGTYIILYNIDIVNEKKNEYSMMVL